MTVAQSQDLPRRAEPGHPYRAADPALGDTPQHPQPVEHYGTVRPIERADLLGVSATGSRSIWVDPCSNASGTPHRGRPVAGRDG